MNIDSYSGVINQFHQHNVFEKNLKSLNKDKSDV